MRSLKMGLLAIVAIVAAIIVAVITAPEPAKAQGPAGKIVICHTPSHRADTIKTGEPCYGPETKGGDPSAVEIEISVNACQAHLGHSCVVQ